jgi:hypothetical protein
VQLRYQSDWISLYDMISHIQAVQRCEAKEAEEDAVKALYDGKVESRVRGSQTTIESHLWASARVFKDGSVSFNWPVAGIPAPGWEPQRHWVEVLRDSVELVWPGPVTTYKTGSPGRPSSVHLIVPEADRRISTGEVPDSLAAFARSLSEWLKTTHPTAARMKQKTIENRLRETWNKRPQK